jgi:hypothetical protein
MKTDWNTNHNGIPHFIVVTANEVVIGSGSGHSENAVSCTHAEFLEGAHQNLILSDFDADVLAEVIESVKVAPTYPPFQEQRDKIAARRAFLNTIPFDQMLAGLHDHPATEQGFKNYSNVGGYRVKSDTMTLTVDRANGFVALNDSETPQYPFELLGFAFGVVALRDHFYLVVSGSYAVIGSYGQALDAPDPIHGIFGAELRINRVYRHGETIFFSYALNVPPDYPKGLLRYELGKGFTGRWEIKA